VDLNYSEDQRILRGTVERFLAGGAGTRGSLAPGKPASGRWSEFAEMGWLALPLPEAYGELGAGAVEVGILMECLGAAQATEPYLSTVILGAGLIAEVGASEAKASILPEVATGKTLLALAHFEEATRYDIEYVATTARRESDGWRLNGRKCVVFGAPSADHIIVSARISGDLRDPAGWSRKTISRSSWRAFPRFWRAIRSIAPIRAGSC
jgi:alkylation response protein AidB-like acyl-CoA dehydrogenase